MNRFALSLVTVFALMLSVTSVQAAQWKKLGERVATKNLNKGQIDVGMSDGRFEQLRLRVKGAGVHFKKVEVNYVLGRSEELDIRKLINDGGKSDALKLSGKGRAIKSVEFWYETRSGKAATVTLWGRKS